MAHSISVVIPVKNEAARIRNCLNGILSQTIPVKEIIVIDSGSTDGTVAILSEFPLVKVIQIKPEDFNHGETRNIGVQHTTGEFVILTVGDARPVDEFWIEHLMKGFEDEQVVSVCGQQVVPHEKDKNPLEWFRSFSAPFYKRYQFSSPEEFYRLTAEEQHNVCSFDDVTAAYRRDVLFKNPFEKTNFAEDMMWAKRALLTGHAIVYNFNARVYHSHLENTEYTFKRVFTTQYFRYKLFGYLKTINSISLMDYLRMIKNLFFKKEIGGIQRRFQWLKYNIALNNTSRMALKEFHDALKNGEEQLDKKYVEFCGKIFTPPR